VGAACRADAQPSLWFAHIPLCEQSCGASPVLCAHSDCVGFLPSPPVPRSSPLPTTQPTSTPLTTCCCSSVSLLAQATKVRVWHGLVCLPTLLIPLIIIGWAEHVVPHEWGYGSLMPLPPLLANRTSAPTPSPGTQSFLVTAAQSSLWAAPTRA